MPYSSLESEGDCARGLRWRANREQARLVARKVELLENSGAPFLVTREESCGISDQEAQQIFDERARHRAAEVQSLPIEDQEAITWAVSEEFSDEPEDEVHDQGAELEHFVIPGIMAEFSK